MPGARIRGKYYDYSSIEIAFTDSVGVCMNISDINYSQKLDPGMFRGTSALLRGRTRGTYDCEGNFTMYKEDYELLKLKLSQMSAGEGYMVQEFNIAVVYREAGAIYIPCVDALKGCRIVSEDHSNSTGNTPIVVKVGLSIMHITLNKQSAVENPHVPGISNIKDLF